MHKKCAHPSCLCVVEAGKEFCSDNCRNSQSPSTGKCLCEHSGCQADK